MADKKIIDRNAVTENNPNDDEEILKNDTKKVRDNNRTKDYKIKIGNTHPKVPVPEKD